MNKQVLQMKYHPAKKEVIFKRFYNGKEVAIKPNSRLRYYMNKRGKFVLQDYGKNFFDDIAKVYDGVDTVNIEVITTKLDYEDFVQMVEHYNCNDGKCKMEVSLISELPDMNQVFQEVEKYGESAIGVLQTHKQKLFDIPLENENVKKSAESFANQIEDEIKNIREKIDSLKDNNVSLCFAGVYSAGKSALINALLGYKILPESAKSKTAKMVQISSPASNENVKISFTILNVFSELTWNVENNCFEFTNGPTENSIRKEIQSELDKLKEDKFKQHEQIKEILNNLNERDEISSVIKIKFPIALDNELVQFTIYDTPGTDSNYIAHQNVLVDALKEQSQSILLFVGKCKALEGEGNNSLLNYLKEVDAKNSKTTIDMGRSLFVLNHADGSTEEERMEMRSSEIKTKDSDFSIKLADKKVFFTSARYAYAAKAVKNGIATNEDAGISSLGKAVFSNPPFGFCYKQNKCAASEFATERMLKRCDEALEKAAAENDETKELLINSGLYALENEILTYGEKYASSVKAFAIIDSVDKALTKLTDRSNSIKDSNQKEIAEIENNIAELRKTISDAIDREYESRFLSPKDKLPEETNKRLRLDDDSLNNLTEETEAYLDKKIKGWFFGIGKVIFKERDKQTVKEKIEDVIEKFTKEFISNRQCLLEVQRDDFMDIVKNAIKENGNISDAAKKVFLNIPVAEIPKYETKDMGDIYNSHKQTSKFLWMDKEYLDKKSFLKDVKEQFMIVIDQMQYDYAEMYRESLDSVLLNVKQQFESNLEQYSVDMKAMIENRDAMKKLAGRIDDSADALYDCQNLLDDTIWREITND